MLLLLIQISVILVTARLVGVLFYRLHQPQVIGEMCAGILLGPSLFGWLAPTLYVRLFPAAGMSALHALSQIGLLLFMFLVGLELNPLILRKYGTTALITSSASMIVPFVLGLLLAFFGYPWLADPHIPIWHFSLFLGTALSVTAFPVLARIITEHGLQQTRIGIIALACAAIGDVTAWCVLAGVVIIVHQGNDLLPLWVNLLGIGLYLIFMLFLVRLWARHFVARYQRQGRISHGLLSQIMILVLASAGITEGLGVHALFGAFLAGVVIPKEATFVQALHEKLEDIAVVLLLPLFFALSGLLVNISLIHGTTLWFWCALIIFTAVLGKLGGATLAARFTGLPWREASVIGVLMNTRGLIELVILNVGLEIGVITPTFFTMMVIMALCTTVMTSPLLVWINPTKELMSQKVLS